MEAIVGYSLVPQKIESILIDVSFSDSVSFICRTITTILGIFHRERSKWKGQKSVSIDVYCQTTRIRLSCSHIHERCSCTYMWIPLNSISSIGFSSVLIALLLLLSSVVFPLLLIANVFQFDLNNPAFIDILSFVSATSPSKINFQHTGEFRKVQISIEFLK